jgi:hypothetical protein
MRRTNPSSLAFTDLKSPRSCLRNLTPRSVSQLETVDRQTLQPPLVRQRGVDGSAHPSPPATTSRGQVEATTAVIHTICYARLIDSLTPQQYTKWFRQRQSLQLCWQHPPLSKRPMPSSHPPLSHHSPPPPQQQHPSPPWPEEVADVHLPRKSSFLP